MTLSFDTLRRANKARLPKFKNANGSRAHRCEDGSDWSFYDWGMAVLGELGELMEVRIQYEGGLLSEEEYAEKAGKEFADIQTYLDIWAMRGKDGRDLKLAINPALILGHIAANLGCIANDTKKFHRGDFDLYEWKKRMDYPLRRLEAFLPTLRNSSGMRYCYDPATVDPEGFNLGEETVKKFNEVSDRIAVNVKIERWESKSSHEVGYTVIEGER